jgi:hypothetical protein
MGRVRPDPPEPVLTFFGESEAFGGEPAKISEAFASAAGKAIEAGLIEEGEHGKTAWFQVTLLEVELGNQHPKTVRIGVTPKSS